MPVVCLYFPQLRSDLAVAARPRLAGRPVVLIAGVGEQALVTARSWEAALGGIVPGMAAGTARSLVSGAVFIPDNAEHCRAALQEMSGRIRADGCGSLETGTDYIAVHAGKYVNAERVVRAAGLDGMHAGPAYRVATGPSIAEALEAAKASRRSRQEKTRETAQSLPRAESQCDIACTGSAALQWCHGRGPSSPCAGPAKPGSGDHSSQRLATAVEAYAGRPRPDGCGHFTACVPAGALV